jgi:hypothetical protein
MAFTIHEMAFKIGDSLVNIPAKKGTEMGDTVLDPIEWIWCLEHFLCHPWCTLLRCAPPHHSSKEIARAFAVLKEELQNQLSKGAIEKSEIEKDLLPQTVAQVDELKQKLQAALVQLDDLRPKLVEKEKD